MLTRRIIPCLDTSDGRVLKGRQFREMRDVGDPAELAARYDATGADELVLLDVTATTGERPHAAETVRAVRRELTIPLTVGGGVRSVEDAERLLDSGADKVALNSAALVRPKLVTALADRFGTQCIVVAIDALQVGEKWMVRARAGSEDVARDAISWAAEAEQLGAGEILLTSIDRDGTRSGFDVALLAAVTSRVSIPVIASGGAQDASDFLAAFGAGADAVLAASIFHDQDTTVGELKRTLAACGVEVRP
ncbi:MAG: imidazole glycerol phosphate synthase subunit HisF [Gemmatimonadales bacterium]